METYTMKDAFEPYKEMHKQRVAKNPARLKYAIEQLEKNEINYDIKNEMSCHIHCFRKSDNKLIEFYAGTGKIKGYDNLRGIKALIKLLNK